MSRTGRQFRLAEIAKRKGGETDGKTSTRWAGKKNRSTEGRPQPQPLPRKQMRQTLQGLCRTDLAGYLEEAD